MREIVLATMLVALAWPAGPAFGQEASKHVARERELLRRAQAAQKQAEEARAAAEADRAKLETELKSVQAKEKATAAEVSQVRKSGDGLRASLDTVTRERDKLREEKTALAERLAQTEARLAKAITEGTVLAGTKAEAERSLAATESARKALDEAQKQCVQKNSELQRLATDLMSKYRAVGFWDVLKRAEPFTGIERARVDALLEDYRDRAEVGRLVSPQ